MYDISKKLSLSFIGMGLCATLTACGGMESQQEADPAEGGTVDSALTNIVYNGSFEQGPSCNCGDATTTYTALGPGDNRLPGWTPHAYGVDHIGTYWAAADGVGSIDMNAYDYGALTQHLSTVAGATYRVTFAMAGNPDCGAQTKTLQVLTSSGYNSVFTFSTAGKSRTNMGWTYKSMQFVANASSTDLTFTSATYGNPCGPALDNVSVVRL